MTEFQKMSIDLSQILDTNASRRLPDPPGFSASVAKEVGDDLHRLLTATTDHAKKSVFFFSRATVVVSLSFAHAHQHPHTFNMQAEASASVRVNKPTATDLAGVAKRQQALFSLATSPVKNAAMMAFMMYMAGTQLHFFSILTTFNGIYSPLSAILKSNLGTFLCMCVLLTT